MYDGVSAYGKTIGSQIWEVIVSLAPFFDDFDLKLSVAFLFSANDVEKINMLFPPQIAHLI